MATGEPTHRQPQSPCRAVAPQRLKRVLAAGGGEPAGRREQRADEAAVADNGHDKEPRRQRRRTFPSVEPILRCAHSWRSAPTCRRSSRPSNQVEIGGQIRLACASGCRVGTQHEQATPGKRGDPPAHQFPEPSLYPVANHRRANRTADNKAYLRPGISLVPHPQAAAEPRNHGLPARRPERSVRRNSSGLLIRDCCGSTTPPAQPRLPAGGRSALSGRVRPRAARGPCGGARPARRGRPGYASAGGSRGPSPADGCSAGTYACSLELQYG